jgi:glucokinase
MKTQYTLGIDIGGTTIKYGICSSGGRLKGQGAVPTPATALKEVILNKLTEAIKETLLFAVKENLPLSAIGIGTPGSVDIHRGYLMGGTPNFKHWRNVSIAKFLMNQFDIPVFVDNDANLMAYGEFVYGAGKEKKDVICLTLGTGIGGGVIINGEIYRGSFFAGAELGHMSINHSGKPCKCGGQGCLERYASATALIEDYNQENPSKPVKGTKQIFQYAEQGDMLAVGVIDQFISYLATGLANIVNIFNPEMIIIGGGVSEAGQQLIEKIRKACQKRAMPVSFKKVEIVRATLGNRAGILGAGAFALKRLRLSGTSSQ